MSNLWHDLPAGRIDEINVIVELSKGSKNKYEIDKATGLIALDRVQHTAQDFPFDYGFVPQTLWDDGDPLDVIILATHPLLPGVLVRVRPVGVMHMTDSGQSDDKLITVPTGDPRWAEVKDLDGVNQHTLKEIKHFYSTYKNLQNKEVLVTGFDDRTMAEKVFTRGCDLYQQKYLPKK